jgi:hypothetical protein
MTESGIMEWARDIEIACNNAIQRAFHGEGNLDLRSVIAAELKARLQMYKGPAFQPYHPATARPSDSENPLQIWADRKRGVTERDLVNGLAPVSESEFIQSVTDATKRAYSQDRNVEAVVDKHRSRAAVGLKKYGVTTERTDLTVAQWLQHAQDEAMDLAIYLERLMSDLKAVEDDSGSDPSRWPRSFIQPRG